MTVSDINSFRENILRKVKDNTLVLPTPPKVALRVQKELKENPDIDAHSLSKLIITDTAIVASVMKAANAVGVNGKQKFKTLPHAIARIGLDRIRGLLFSLAIEQMFLTNSSIATAKLEKTWDQSINLAVNALAFINLHYNKDMTRHINPDVLTLVAISHRIGHLPIYSEISELSFDTDDDYFIAECENKLNPILTKAILLNWRMDAEIVRGAVGWQLPNNASPILNYADIIRLVSIRLGQFPFDRNIKNQIWDQALKDEIIPSNNFFDTKEFSDKCEEIKKLLQ